LYNRSNRFEIALSAVACLVFLVLFWYGSIERIEKIKIDSDYLDQGAIMWYAKELHDTGYRWPGDGNRSPLYPLIQSLFYDTNMPWESFLVQGKYVNLILSLFILVGLFFIFHYHLSMIQTVALLGITAFTVFIFRAGYANYAHLYYFLGFVTFLLMCHMFVKPSLRTGALCGVAAGLSFLTKVSMLPGVIIFVVVYVLKEVFSLSAGRSRATDGTTPGNGLAYRLVCLGLFVVLFMAVISPQITANKRVFGTYFYNINPTFYVWYDSWEEACSGTRAHGDRNGWPEMSPDMIPSPSKYWREHSIREMVARLFIGSVLLAFTSVTSYGWFKYVLILAGMALIGIITNPTASLKNVREQPFLIVFVLSYLSGYYMAYCWFGIIGAHFRYIVFLFLPFVFSCAMAINATFDDSNTLPLFGRRVPFSDIWGYILLAMICIELYPIMTHRIIFPG
jgi:hypothetical protein